jgi:hypothetical protein
LGRACDRQLMSWSRKRWMKIRSKDGQQGNLVSSHTSKLPALLHMYISEREAHVTLFIGIQIKAWKHISIYIQQISNSEAVNGCKSSIRCLYITHPSWVLFTLHQFFFYLALLISSCELQMNVISIMKPLFSWSKSSNKCYKYASVGSKSMVSVNYPYIGASVFLFAGANVVWPLKKC